MRAYTSLLVIALLAVGRATPARADEPSLAAEEAAPDTPPGEPVGGAGVSPIELVPRLELRQSYMRPGPGVSIHDTIAEMDLQFLKRLLLRYQVPRRLIETPKGEFSGFGDVQLTLIGIVASNPTALFGVIVGGVFNTASQPPLGAGKQQLVVGAGGAFKPRRWLLPYAVVQEQVSLGGDDTRPDVNQLSADVGAILFGKQYNWIKLDLLPTVDFPGGAVGRLLGVFEVGSLVVGRVGLFVRAGTQLAGREELDYSLAAGVRYLFRLEQGKPKPD